MAKLFGWYGDETGKPTRIGDVGRACGHLRGAKTQRDAVPRMGVQRPGGRGDV